MKISIDDAVLEEKDIYEVIQEAMREATIREIKANSIVINRGLVFVPGDPFAYPDMICGLKSYITSSDLPEDYAFAVLHDANREQKIEMEWISVEDRLPEDYQHILTYDGNCVEPGVFYEKSGFFELDKYESDPLWAVTHWMPLPKPPKEV